MKKFITFAIAAACLATVPMLCAVAAGAYLLFAAPTIFGVMLITGGVLYVTKNIIIATATLSLIVAMYVTYKAMKSKEDDASATITDDFGNVKKAKFWKTAV